MGLFNSSTVSVDAVLTTRGKELLSTVDSGFNITKYALGDEEIDYSLYNSSHSSGSAYYDLEILQVPVLEAFTNNASLMKSKLIFQWKNLFFMTEDLNYFLIVSIQIFNRRL